MNYITSALARLNHVVTAIIYRIHKTLLDSVFVRRRKSWDRFKKIFLIENISYMGFITALNIPVDKILCWHSLHMSKNENKMGPFFVRRLKGAMARQTYPVYKKYVFVF